jgi:cytochrome c peroxidase
MQDGRANTLAEQARLPLLSFNEMANKSAAEVVAKMKKADYREQFLQAFGAAALDDTKQAFDFAAEALQAFQKEDISFHPFTSKYDLYNSNKIGGDLTPAEARGLRVFLDPNKGNCFACHYSGAGLNGSVALFTDFSYAAIGVPRNTKEQPASVPRPGHTPAYDLGICGRADHRGPKNKQYCGMFKTPTLRNVATRQVFFHNGQIRSLAEALRFYNTRDTQPALWYPKVNGRVRKFDDLPAAYHANIDIQAPLDGRKAGSKPPMTDEDLKDLEAFLDILTDGYVVPAKQAARQATK